MIAHKRRTRQIAKKRPLPRFIITKPPTPALAAIEAQNRENGHLRDIVAGVQCLVADINIRRCTVVDYVVAINAIRKLVQS